MKTNRLKRTSRIMAAAAAASMIVGTLGAPAASAGQSWGYSVGRTTESACVSALNTAMTRLRSQGWTITHLKRCTGNSGGYWNGYFRYSKGGPVFY